MACSVKGGTWLRALWPLIGLLWGACVWAEEGPPIVSFLSQYLSPMDWSVYYLGEITGTVNGLLLNGNSPVMGMICRIFNGVVLSIVLIIVIGTTGLSLMHTAQEGEIMGKKWSFIWVPLRALLGLFLLVPTSSGYSSIQIFILWIVLQGIAGANAIWGLVLDNFIAGHSVEATITVTPDVLTVTQNQSLMSIFNASMCNAYLNAMMNTLPPSVPVITVFQDNPLYLIPVGPNLTLFSTDIYAGPYKTQYLEAVAAGSNPDQSYRLPALARMLPGAAVCGSVLINSPDLSQEPASEQNTLAHTVLMNNARSEMTSVLTNMDVLAQVAINSYMANPASYPGSLQNLRPSDIAPILNNIAVSWQKFMGPVAVPRQDAINAMNQARANGWLNAGSYYYLLVLKNQKVQSMSNMISNPTVVGPSQVLNKLLGEPFTTLIGIAPQSGTLSSNAAWTALWSLDQKGHILTPAASLTGLPALADGGSYIDRFLSFIGIGSSMASLTNHFIDLITHNRNNPLESMANFGQFLLHLADDVLVIVAGVSITLALVTAWMSCQGSAGPAINNTIDGLSGAVMGLLGILFLTGASMGIYLPLIPFIVYFASVVGWFVGVIEGVIASPLIAIGLATPSEDEFGKAAHSLLLMVNLFLRPALIVVGFISAIKVYEIAIAMLSFGFSSTLHVIHSEIGPFSMLAIVIFHTGIVLTITHRSFAVIHLIPDKIIRWIGQQGEESDADSFLKKVSDATDKGGEAAQKASQGLMNTLRKNKGKG